jgi:hypothetical protein
VATIRTATNRDAERRSGVRVAARDQACETEGVRHAVQLDQALAEIPQPGPRPRSARAASSCPRARATTTPFDMVMLNDLDRFHLVMDVIDRVPGLAQCAATLHQHMSDERLRQRAHARETGDDAPDVRDWVWPGSPRRPRPQPTPSAASAPERLSR